jgi:hypothetical protein
VSGERHFQEVVALALMIPPMLGWYWLFKVVNRHWSTFG